MIIGGERNLLVPFAHTRIPIVDAEQHHRSRVRVRLAVEVKRCVLKDLLHGTRFTGTEDDAATRNADEAVLTDAIEEVLARVTGEEIGRLVPVVPRGNPETLTVPHFSRIPFAQQPRAHFAGAGDP